MNIFKLLIAFLKPWTRGAQKPMKTINEPRLMHVISEEVQASDFPTEEYQDFIENFGSSVDSVVKTCLIALMLYEDTRMYLSMLFSGRRTVPKNRAIERIEAKYFQHD